MKIARFQFREEVKFGVIEGDSIFELSGSIYNKPFITDENYKLSETNLLSPVQPSKVVCIGKNYKEHILELGGDIPAEPIIFLKPPTSVIGPGALIKYPSSTQRVDYEGELAVVIKSPCANISPESAASFILGYTCANDVTARDLQQRDGQWSRAKGFDTFCPVGPWIETDISPDELRIRTYLNGELRQNSNTSMMITPVHNLISFISKVMTLLPGDIVLTGTPEGISSMQRGDTVEVVIENIGKLKNYIL